MRREKGGKMIESIHDVDILDEEELLYNYPELYDNNALLRRSNVLIKSRFRATMVESKMLILTMYRCQQIGNRSVSFTANDLKTLLHLDDNSYIYTQLKTIASHLIDHKFYIEESRSKWAFYSFFEAAEYENGTMRLTLSEAAYRHITALQTNYTSMELPVLLSFGIEKDKPNRQNFSLRIYELMKTYLFHVTEARPTYRCRYFLQDLKLSIGAISPDDPGVRDAIIKNPGNYTIDLNKYASKKENSSYSRWTDFDRRVLRVAADECNKSTDIYIEYSPVRSGKGGKVTEVIFTISKNPNYVSEKVKDIKPDITLVEQVHEMLGGKVRTKTIMKLLSAAGNDIERIRRAALIASKQQDTIRNLSGFLLKAIQEEWEYDDMTGNYPMKFGLMKEIGTENKKRRLGTKIVKSRNAFNNFEQNEYDFEQLELDLLSNQ